MLAYFRHDVNLTNLDNEDSCCDELGNKCTASRKFLQWSRLRFDRHVGEKYDNTSLWLFWCRLKSWNSRQVVSNFSDSVPAIFRYSPLGFFYYWNEIQCLPALGKNFQNAAQGFFTSPILHMKTLWNFSEFLWRMSVPRRSNHKFWCSWEWRQLPHHYARNRIPRVLTPHTWQQTITMSRRSGATF